MNFQAFEAAAAAAIQLLPVITSAVAAAEQLFPQGSNGAQKLEVVRSALAHAYTVAGNAQNEFDALWPTLMPIVNACVAAYTAIKH